MYSELFCPLDRKTQVISETAAHITLRSITNNHALDSIIAKWEPILAEKLDALNEALAHVTPEIRTELQRKLVGKEKRDGKRAITDADRWRWLLPDEKWEAWEVPFDADPDWPRPLQDALQAYRQAWRAKMDEVNRQRAAGGVGGLAEGGEERPARQRPLHGGRGAAAGSVAGCGGFAHRRGAGGVGDLILKQIM